MREVTPSLIAEAVSRLKSGKSDPVFEFSSDCIKNAPTLFYEHLALVFRSFLIHGHISSVLMVSTLISLLKDKLGDICASRNYRSIALSSEILKIFDWVIILLYGERLNLDDLQFVYQPDVSTNMCTWMAVETIQHFLRNGSEVFICAMDMYKAFDKVKHRLLFYKLLDRGVPEIFIRLLVCMYRKQLAYVRWNNSDSQQFPLRNGVKQGAVLSTILYCLYMNDLYQILRNKKYGCWINGEYSGILGYSDDILLQSPSINALKEMLKTCENYANEHNLLWDLFGTEAKRLEKSWNVSLRKILRLPYNAQIFTRTYNYFPVFEIYKLYSSKKSAVRNLFNVVRNDCRSITGSNLRRIMLKPNRNCVEEIYMNDISNQNTPNGCEWANNMVKEIVEHNSGLLVVPGFNGLELADISNDVCAS